MIDNESSGIVCRPILIFPAGMPRSLEYLQKCLRDGQSVIGASSLEYDVSRDKYPQWLYLPYITHSDFDNALKQAIIDFDIAGVYSPNFVVWNYLNRVLKEIAPSIVLENTSPVNAELDGYRAAQCHAHALIKNPLPLSVKEIAKPSISEIELSSLFRHADLIPGMCDHEKLCVLCEIARYSPCGDVVEIGSWWGKSAFILARLAHCYNIGNLLCVDPWSNEHLVQHDEKGLVDSGSAEMDANEAINVFEINLLPYNFNHINYLRMPSVEGAKHYSQHKNATTASFGSTNYSGHIAILHIDGNHSYAAAKADIVSWGHFVVKGGWIIFDDYIWPYGDGPQRVGDEFLVDNHDNIDVAFVMGSALFVQIAS